MKQRKHEVVVVRTPRTAHDPDMLTGPELWRLFQNNPFMKFKEFKDKSWMLLYSEITSIEAVCIIGTTYLPVHVCSNSSFLLGLS